jgi:hypothetical protein
MEEEDRTLALRPSRFGQRGHCAIDCAKGWHRQGCVNPTHSASRILWCAGRAVAPGERMERRIVTHFGLKAFNLKNCQSHVL